MRIKGRFNNVLELKPGDLVKVAGMPVGRVEALDVADNKVVVTMKITHRKAVLRTDSRATVKFIGLMGQNYVAIDFGPGKGAPLLPDAEIETYDQPDVGALMTKFENVATSIKKMTDTFGEANFNDLIPPLTDFIKENRPRVSAILTNVQAVSEQLAAGKGTAGKLIYDDTLHRSALAAITNLTETSDDIRATVAEAKSILGEISAGKGTVGKLAKEEKLYQDATEAVSNLKEILQKINQGQGSAGKLVNDDALFKNAKMTMQKLDKAMEGLEDQGPLSVLGIAINSLF
jgi:phospholipid/cholesterol/gamma-HCH transport system substrate-binding protein